MQENTGELTQLLRTESYLKSDPENRDLLARAIDQAIEAKAIAKAEHHAMQALALFPADSFFRYRFAHVLLLQQKYAEAASIFVELLESQKDLNIMASLAGCWQALGRYQDVMALLSPVQEDSQLPAGAATLLLRAYHHLGQLEQALALFHMHEARLNTDASFLSAASLILFDLGDATEAGRLSDAALALGARPIEALITNASLALGNSEVSRAQEQFNEVLQKIPTEGRSWSGLGMASMLENNLPRASEQLEKAMEYLPTHIGTVHAAAWCKLLAGDIEAAHLLFQKAMDMDRNFGESHGGLAVIFAMKGQREMAEAAIERALRLDANGMSARYAQMVLSGDAADPTRFNKMAKRLLEQRDQSMGLNLSEMVARYAKL